MTGGFTVPVGPGLGIGNGMLGIVGGAVGSDGNVGCSASAAPVTTHTVNNAVTAATVTPHFLNTAANDSRAPLCSPPVWPNWSTQADTGER
ncbi:hypothetical protein Aglo01_53850 [Actinokineospora globicatena]|nr:hypothetical protein Aglo01_53850 [Actinokineospora globicatena]GLW88097.1 hypothetical protein Aglo02_57360 [Actinokineospora globicatena]